MIPITVLFFLENALYLFFNLFKTYPTLTCHSTGLLACLTHKVPRCQALPVDWLCHYKMARYREQEYLGLMRSLYLSHLFLWMCLAFWKKREHAFWAGSKAELWDENARIWWQIGYLWMTRFSLAFVGEYMSRHLLRQSGPSTKHAPDRSLVNCWRIASLSVMWVRLHTENERGELIRQHYLKGVLPKACHRVNFIKHLDTRLPGRVSCNTLWGVATPFPFVLLPIRWSWS